MTPSISRLPRALCLALGLLAAASAGAAELSPAERAAAGRAFVAKWGPYVERVHGVSARTWSERMGSTFAAADADNLRTALDRDTFEGAVAALTGAGHRLDDAEVIHRLARNTLAGGAGDPAAERAASAKVLGDVDRDQVFTAVPPCRLADTRLAGGILGAGTSRNLYALAALPESTFTSQGGSASNCGLYGIGASAVVLNVTVVSPANVGFATVHRFGQTRPTAASLTYQAGNLLSNTVVSQVPIPVSTFDISLYSSAQAHYVVDIVGYYSAPRASELQCVGGTVNSFFLAANTVAFFNNSSCPTGYSAVSAYCYSPDVGVRSQGSGLLGNVAGNVSFCAWENGTGTSKNVFGGSLCCRNPGR